MHKEYCIQEKILLHVFKFVSGGILEGANQLGDRNLFLSFTDPPTLILLRLEKNKMV